MTNKNELFEALKDWNFWEKDLNTGISRKKYTKRLGELVQTSQVVVVTGPRRSGKSYILRQFAKRLIESGTPRNQILTINFEDPRLPVIDAKGLEEVYKLYLEFKGPQDKPYLLLDEIQEVEGWEKWVRTMHDLDKAHLVISGSNAKLLSKELATLLSGQHIDLNVFLLSFSEFMAFNGLTIVDENDAARNEIAIKNFFRRYLEEGGYPEVTLSLQKKEILLAYFDDIINKDLIRRYHIRKGESLLSLARFLLSQSASMVTHSSSARFLGITTGTAEKFAGYLDTAFLISFLKRFSFKVKEQEKSPRKVYSIDTGLANAVGFRFSENLGRLAENIVFRELMKRKVLDPGLELFFWKDTHHREVDFVVKDIEGVKELIQVSWDLNNYPQTKGREFRSLFLAMEKLKCNNALIITEDQETVETINGKTIKIQPLWKWLLAV
ncbi:MAG: ATP-binding protein [Candidatus Margulisbacteria bacterium]|nr:ATP-binding protein [Candidatus Margulisiibacteriota bacterium]